jgi:hypothetical protein
MGDNPNNIYNPMNTYNFLPGYSSYIHAFIGGYSGIRVRDFQLDIIYPSLRFDDYTSSSPASTGAVPIKTPYPSIDYWNITGLSYRGFELDIIYNLRAKQLIVKNRRLTEGFQLPNQKGLEILFYEYDKRDYRTLNVGEQQIFNLNTALWTTPVVKKKKTLPKNPALPKQNIYYSNNIDVLITIYSTQFRDYLVYDSSAGNYMIKYVNLFFCLSFCYLFYRF